MKLRTSWNTSNKCYFVFCCFLSLHQDPKNITKKNVFPIKIINIKYYETIKLEFLINFEN